MLYYCGVGSRQTPEYICDLMAGIAAKLQTDGYVLRSGHAVGADRAFELGANSADSDIYLPWSTFGCTPYRNDPGMPVIGRSILPATGAGYDLLVQHGICTPANNQAVVKLHGRNTYQVLGHDLSNPARFVICWTPNADLSGGTRIAIQLAHAFDIPVFNLADPATQNKLLDYIAD